MEAHAPNSLDLLIGNLKLLNYDIEDANQIFRLQLEQVDSSLYLKNTSQKVIIHTVHFLLQLICQEELQEFELHFKIQQYKIQIILQEHFKSKVIIKGNALNTYGNQRELEKFQGTSPTVKPSLMKNKDLDKQEIILRFLSEFALRHQFTIRFPKKQLRSFYPNPMELMIGDNKYKSTFNELSDIFTPASFQLEGPHGFQMDKCTVSDEELCVMIDLMKSSIPKELQKLNKVFTRNVGFLDNVVSLVQTLVDKNNIQREQLISLDQNYQTLKKQIQPKYMSQERKLDRIPLIDLYQKLFKNIQELVIQYQKLNVDQKIYRFTVAQELNDYLSKLQKSTITTQNVDFINIHELYKTFGEGLLKQESEILKQQNKTWVLDSSTKLKQDSEQQLMKLRQIKQQYICQQ